jgi:hypothetical protein
MKRRFAAAIWLRPSGFDALAAETFGVVVDDDSVVAGVDQDFDAVGAGFADGHQLGVGMLAAVDAEIGAGVFGE